MNDAPHPVDCASGTTLQHVLANHGNGHGDRLFCDFVYGDERSCTYGELERLVSGTAKALTELGVQRGSRVVVFMSNTVEYFAAMLGIQRAGAVYVPCSLLYAQDEVEYLISNSGAEWMFVDDTTADRAAVTAAAFPSLKFITQGNGPGSVACHADVFVEAPETFEPVAGPDDLAMIMYTSGTTARPKGVMFNHGSLVHAALNMAGGLEWRADERVLHYFPLHHANGGLVQLAPTLLRGSAFIMVQKFSASRFSAQLHDHKITFAAVNSTHVKMILAQEPSPLDADHPCRRMMFGLSAPVAVRDEFAQRFNTVLIGTYGLTEVTGPCVLGSPYIPTHPDAAGRVIPGYEMRVAPADADSAARDATAAAGDGLPDNVGELLIRAGSRYAVCAGYWRNDEATAALFRDGWVHSGDIGYIDDGGGVHFVDRGKDMIKRSGFNVAPAEVERVLLSHETVDEAIVVGAPDDLRDEEIVAFVVTREDTATASIIEHCSTRLANYKVPSRVIVVDEIPKDVLGKADRKQLRARASSSM